MPTSHAENTPAHICTPYVTVAGTSAWELGTYDSVIPPCTCEVSVPRYLLPGLQPQHFLPGLLGRYYPQMYNQIWVVLKIKGFGGFMPVDYKGAIKTWNKRLGFWIFTQTLPTTYITTQVHQTRSSLTYVSIESLFH